MMNALSFKYRTLAACSYLIWPVSLALVLTTYRRDRFLRFHGYQALYFGLCSSVIYLVVGGFLQIIPIVGNLLFNCLILIWLVFVVLLMRRCWHGDFFRVPLIYDLARGVME